MKFERIKNTIQDAEQQERTAFYAKTEAYNRLKDRLEHYYEEDLDNYSDIKDWKFKISHAYESTAVTLNLFLHATDEIQEQLTHLHDEIDELDPYYAYRDRLRQRVRNIVLDDYEPEPRLVIRFKDDSEWERMQND